MTSFVSIVITRGSTDSHFFSARVFKDSVHQTNADILDLLSIPSAAFGPFIGYLGIFY